MSKSQKRLEELLEVGNPSVGRLSEPFGKYNYLVYNSTPKSDVVPECNPSPSVSSSTLGNFGSCNIVNSEDQHIVQEYVQVT